MFLIVDDTSIHRFNGSRVLIGRSKECDLMLDDALVSPSQCRLTRESDGSWTVENVGETEIFLNRTSLHREGSSRINASDRLHIGNFDIELRDTEQAARLRAHYARNYSRLKLNCTPRYSTSSGITPACLPKEIKENV